MLGAQEMGFLENTAGTKENMHYSIIEPLPVVLGNSRVLGGIELFVCLFVFISVSLLLTLQLILMILS